MTGRNRVLAGRLALSHLRGRCRPWPPEVRSAVQDPMGEACEAVQAAAPKGKAAIRRMLTAEFQARDFSLPPELFDVLVNQLAAGTYAPGEPVVSVHRTGLLRVPFIRKAIRQAFQQADRSGGPPE